MTESSPGEGGAVPVKLRLIDNWKTEARRLWSAQAAAASVVFWSAVGGLILVWPGIAGSIPVLWYAFCGVALSVAFGLARFLKQPGTDE